MHIKYISKVWNVRVANNQTMEQVAKRAGIAQSSLSEIENGKKIPKITTLIKIAIALNCDVSDLYSYDIL